MQDRESETMQTLLRSLLILRGAISLYEENAPEICRILLANQKDSLYDSIDQLGEALYWLREQLSAEYSAVCQP